MDEQIQPQAAPQMPEMHPAPAETGAGSKKWVWIVVAIAVVAILGFAAYYFWFSPEEPSTQELSQAPQEPQGSQISVSSAPQDIGSELYEQSANPIAGNLPDNVAPVANPMDGAYINPFE